MAWQKANPERKAASDKKQNAKPERKAKHLARSRRRYEADPASAIARTTEWARRNPETALARAARYRASNPESVAEAQKRYHDSDEYKRIHRMRSQVQRAIRKAAEFGLPTDDSITREQWQQVIERFDGRCCYCDAADQLSIEHLTPLIRGGTNAPGNIAPACNPCNRRKWKRTLEEFAPERADEIRRLASF